MVAGDTSRSDTEPTAVGIGREIRAGRQRLGLSMRELAARIETSQPFVSNLENGRIFPSLRTLAVIAEALEVPPDRLLPSREHAERVDASIGMRPRREGERASRRVAGGASTRLHAYRVELAGGEVEPRPFVHDGDDFVLVLSGTLAVLREGLPPLLLESGGSTAVDGTVPHRLQGGPQGGTALLISTTGPQHNEAESSR